MHKIPIVNNSVNKTDYGTKVCEIKKKVLLLMIMINILLLKNLIS